MESLQLLCVYGMVTLEKQGDIAVNKFLKCSFALFVVAIITYGKRVELVIRSLVNIVNRMSLSTDLFFCSFSMILRSLKIL